MIGIRLGLYLSLMLLMGLAAFPLYALRDQERNEGRIIVLKKGLIGWAIIAAILSLLGFQALVAGMMGTSLFAFDWEMSRPILTETSIGTAWLVRMAALAGVFLAVLTIKRSDAQRLLAIVITSAIALGTLVWTGHAGATEETLGNIHKASDVLHMFAAAIWLGGIAAFLKMLQDPGDRLWGDRLFVAHRALDNFARVGAVCVAVIVTTGLINGQILVGFSNIAAAFDTAYGQLLVLKVLLVGVMLIFAAKNRWRLTPNLAASLAEGDTTTAVAALRNSLLIEGAAAIAILGLVAWLGTLEPTVSIMASA